MDTNVHPVFNNQSLWFESINSTIIETSSSKTQQMQKSSPVQLYLITIFSCCIISFSSMLTLFMFLKFINGGHINDNCDKGDDDDDCNDHVDDHLSQREIKTKLKITKGKKLQKKKSISHSSHGAADSAKKPFDPQKSEILKLVLAFAVGGLVADVFLHILPEASVELSRIGYSIQQLQHFLGAWILVGLVVFATIETFFQLLSQQKDEDPKSQSTDIADSNEIIVVDHNLNVEHQTIAKSPSPSPSSSSSYQLPKHLSTNSQQQIRQRKHINAKNSDSTKSEHPIKDSHKSLNANAHKTSTVNATGYLNLLANSFDNFTHGMSVAASYLISYKMGILTTAAIAIHEIPHEIVDFVILLRSGFTCLDAFRAQLSISLVTIVGSLTVLYFDQFNRPDSTLSYTLWILPLTSGGFIYIALTSLLPELLKVEYDVNDEEDDRENFVPNGQSTQHSLNAYRKQQQLQRKRSKRIQILSKRIVFVIFGIIVMEAVNTIDL